MGFDTIEINLVYYIIISAQVIIEIARKNSSYNELDVAYSNCLIHAAS